MKTKKYLVYKIENKKNKKIYIGVHSTYNENDGYMGSGTNIRKAVKEHGLENFDKTILYQFENKEDALAKEKKLVNREFISREDTYNIILGGGGFLTTDTVPVKDENNNYFRVHKTDPRYLSGELISIATGTVVVKDKNGYCFKVNKNDSRYILGELVGVSKNFLPVKDKNNNYFKVHKDDPRYLSGELIFIATGMITVKDKNENFFQVDKTDPRYLSGELVPTWKNRKHNKESKQKIGKANSKHQTGSGNSQYGKMWIYNESLKESKRINKNEQIPQDWKRGRKIKF